MKKFKRIIMSFLLLAVMLFPMTRQLSALSGDDGVYIYNVNFTSSQTSFHSVIAHSGTGQPIGRAYSFDANGNLYPITSSSTSFGTWSATINSGGPYLVRAITSMGNYSITASR